jgi:serine kinase of HPr protein (carbohydrate metabolism regulator)
LKEARELVHGTVVALGRSAALLRGGSGSGKSDLALRFMALQSEGALKPELVSDDQVWAEVNPEGSITVSAPETIAGQIEARGLGILRVPYLAQAKLVLVCDLVSAESVPRMPPEPWERTVIAGVPVPVVKLDPFELSAPLKLKLALLLAPEQPL